jgi:phosphoribosyl-AMP cyclohydrolase
VSKFPFFLKKDLKRRTMIPELKYDEKNLIPAIIQDVDSGDVMMLAYMNSTSLEMTLETGFAHFWSRSRQKYWKKGETSGHVQEVREIWYDCDADTLLVKVVQHGPGACHTGNRTCFFRKIKREAAG